MKTTLPSFGLVALLSLVTVGRADVIEIDSSNPVESGHFGGSCSGIPDLDGDAVGDFIVGGWLETVGSTPFAGRVYVYSGKDWSLIHTHISPHVEFQGGYGQSVVGIGDINGDGRGDYIVGSENEDVGGFINSGRVYVYSGASGTLIRTHAMPGIMSFARFGHDVDAVPDLTNDGRPDYIVGAEGVSTSSNGQAFLFDGATGLLVRTIDPPDSADASFGMSVAGIPDINGDGRGDYAVGAPYADPGQAPADSGRVFVFSGVDGALAHTFAPPAPTLSGRFGWALAGIHDAGGDGLGDLLIGVPFDSVGPVASAGRAYIYSCASALLTQTFLSPTLESNGQFGRSIVGVGDRNGDGLEDVLIGAPGVGGGTRLKPGARLCHGR